MATPIQYTPQYIPTDMGLMSNMLDRKQAKYDAGYSAPLSFEDEFSQIDVSPENIAGKQAVLGNFKGRIQEIVDQYGGDYGAASKDIARAISKERGNEFYQLAPQHTAALKRQQALKDKYGANAIAINEVPRSFINEQGEVQDVNLDPTILNQLDLERTLQTEFSKRGSKPRQSGLYKTKNTPEGFLQQSTIRGITEEEFPGVMQEMEERLYTMHPELQGDPRAKNIAENMARQLIGGSTIDYRNDPTYSKDAESPFGTAVDYATTGTGIPGDSGDVAKGILEESSVSPKGKAEWLLGKSGDRKSPKGYLGTSEFGSANSTLENMFGSVVISNSPELQHLQNTPVSSVDLSSKDSRKLADMGLYIDSDIQSIIKSAEDDYQVVKDRISKLTGISKLITGENDFSKSLFKKVVEYTNGDTELANNIIDSYDGNQSKWEKTYRDDVDNLVNSDAFNKSNEFGFTTIDALTKSGKSTFDKVIGLSKHQLTPDRIEFLTGDYSDKNKEDRVEAYKSEGTQPQIIGVGGDDQNGIIFIVKQPNGEQALAKLDVADNFTSTVAMHMGRSDLISAPMYKTAFDQIPKQEIPVGEDLYSHKLDDGTAILYQKQNGQETPITNRFIRELSQELESSGYQGIKVKESANDDTPFRFRSPAEYFSILKYLNNQ